MGLGGEKSEKKQTNNKLKNNKLKTAIDIFRQNYCYAKIERVIQQKVSKLAVILYRRLQKIKQLYYCGHATIDLDAMRLMLALA